MNITNTVNSNVSALIKSATIAPQYSISKSRIKKLRRLASSQINKLIDEYTLSCEIGPCTAEIVNISSLFSSSIVYTTLNIICSIIWQIQSDTSDDGIQQMMVDFIAEFIISNSGNEMKLIGVYDKLPIINEIGLYEVNDRAIGIENPRYLLQFL
jgi:hypothetical protein